MLVRGQVKCRSFVVVHAGAASERVPFQPNRPAALKLVSQARPVERTDSFPRSLALGDRLWACTEYRSNSSLNPSLP